MYKSSCIVVKFSHILVRFLCLLGVLLIVLMYFLSIVSSSFVFDRKKKQFSIPSSYSHLELLWSQMFLEVKIVKKSDIRPFFLSRFGH